MKKYRFILWPGLIVIFIGLTTIVFTLPKVQSLFLLKKDLVLTQEKLSRLTQKVSLLQTLDEAQLEKQVLLMEKALPSRKAMAETLSLVAALTEETGVNFVDFEVSPGQWLSEDLETVICSLGVSGGYEELGDFISKIHQSLPVLRVVSFDMEEGEFVFGVEAYSSPLPESLGEIDLALPQLSLTEENTYQKVAGFRSFTGESLVPLPTGKENLFSGF